jgi:D-glycero-D-manno-heptose 1,7-bisphosphate phosphatase
MARPEARSHGLMKAVFVDRDGVINENLPNHVLCAADLRLLPGSLEALALLAGHPLRVVVVTNQAAIGRGQLTPTELRAIHADLLHQVLVTGGRIDGIYVCPHRPDEGCDCRKPGIGLLEQAAADLDVQLAGSYMVGDAASDVEAAVAARCQPILVLTGRGRTAREALRTDGALEHWVARDLRHAADMVLAREQASGELACAGT